ncbi:signal peptidase I [Candidatus Nomurabacteria bacterium RIFCSPLOWO2_01_FULL_39_18]|uniref:Signal peptidase I n=1 Tax=Candidatus Nomurabacteria bacterium RIFCSPHIGHO2_01_FULL_40_24b TaxID=1801739 RepID=A0A1F6V6K9_9BACT|nr:MAG: signal peptidase I [Candidatus Nomurabacteria bacterium RIFCSPHIGHO2_01_FULL_40_24b]OGI89321.1 MAG: signal peptidase I [Candidatus Nomurabacteria bacterium RIFCSPLOWO2_01_FULL_39_18]
MEGEIVEEKKQPEEKSESAKQSFWELVRFALLALLIVAPIRVLVAEPFVVSGASMVPTFLDGDYLVVDKLSYKLNDPERYDVIIFKYPNDTTKFFIKRIIGLPNETVDIKGSVITITNALHKDGFKIDQPFVKNTANNNNTHYEIKSGEYFVMGDNRSASSDSRYWGGVKRELISGKALLRLLPIKNIGVFPGQYEQSE